MSWDLRKYVCTRDILIVESMIQVSRSVPHWSSYCTTCGKTAPPFEKNHTKVASDCLVAWKNRTSGWNRKSAWGRCRDGQLGRWKEGSWNYCQNGKAHWCCHWYWQRIIAESAGWKAESLRLSRHYGRSLCFANLPFFFMFHIVLLLQCSMLSVLYHEVNHNRFLVTSPLYSIFCKCEEISGMQQF